MKRNTYIDFIKIIMALIVALGHFGISFPIDAGYAVTVFFIISGYYLAKSQKKVSTISYISKRIEKMYLKYIIIFCAAFVFTVRGWIFEGKFTVRAIIDCIQEILLLQGLGFTKTSVNPTMWFFSVLLIGSCILYFIYKNFPRKIQVFFILIVVVGGTLLFSCSLDPWGMVGGIFYVPLLRGIYGLTLGGVLYYILPFYKKVPVLVRFILMAASVFGSFVIGSSNNSYIVFVFLILLFVFQFEQTRRRLPWENFTDRYTYLSENIYYCHYIIAWVLNGIFKRFRVDDIFIEGIIYFIFVVAAAIIFEKVIRAMKQNCIRRGRKYYGK